MNNHIIPVLDDEKLIATATQAISLEMQGKTIIPSHVVGSFYDENGDTRFHFNREGVLNELDGVIEILTQYRNDLVIRGNVKTIGDKEFHEFDVELNAYGGHNLIKITRILTTD